MISDGLKLMVLGVGTVFSFLGLMVVFMVISAKVLAPFAHVLEAPAAAPKRKSKPEGKQPKNDEDKQLAAAAIAAVHMHRNRKK